MFARIDKLSTDDIKITANRLINDEDHVLAAIGTIGKLPDYNWIREKTFHKH
jgi:mitochondrial-processing peptidase subunit beta